MFLFLHGVGNDRLNTIKTSYLSQGLVPYIHEHSGCNAPNTLVLVDAQNIMNFILQYTETNTILLPSCIPGYKLDDTYILLASTIKRAVWSSAGDCNPVLPASTAILHFLLYVKALPPAGCCSMRSNRPQLDMPMKQHCNRQESEIRARY